MRPSLDGQFRQAPGGSRVARLSPAVLPAPVKGLTGSLQSLEAQLGKSDQEHRNPESVNELDTKRYFLLTITKKKMLIYLDLNLFSFYQIYMHIMLALHIAQFLSNLCFRLLE